MFCVSYPFAAYLLTIPLQKQVTCFLFDPENVGDTIPRNVCKLLQSYKALQPITSPSSEPSIPGLIREETCAQYLNVFADIPSMP
jgi:hypothetical protein